MDEFWKCDEYYFSESVDRAFGQNMFVPGVGLTVVFPLTPYAKANGRKLTPRAIDRLWRGWAQIISKIKLWFAEFLSVQVQNGQPCIWAKVNPQENVIVSAKVVIIGTGNPANASENMQFVGTYQLHDGNFVGHVFVQSAQPTCATCGDSGRGLPTLSDPDGAENACRDCGSIV